MCAAAAAAVADRLRDDRGCRLPGREAAARQNQQAGPSKPSPASRAPRRWEEPCARPQGIGLPPRASSICGSAAMRAASSATVIRRAGPTRARPRRRRTTYTLASADLGHRIRVVVIARNPRGSASTTSRPTALVQRIAPTKQVPQPSPSPESRHQRGSGFGAGQPGGCDANALDQSESACLLSWRPDERRHQQRGQ